MSTGARQVSRVFPFLAKEYSGYWAQDLARHRMRCHVSKTTASGILKWDRRVNDTSLRPRSALFLTEALAGQVWRCVGPRVDAKPTALPSYFVATIIAFQTLFCAQL